jgi:hypothetical protein
MKIRQITFLLGLYYAVHELLIRLFTLFAAVVGALRVSSASRLRRLRFRKRRPKLERLALRNRRALPFSRHTTPCTVDDLKRLQTRERM